MLKGAAQCICQRQCPKVRKVICGSDGKLYANHCELHRAACIKSKPLFVDHNFGCSSSLCKLIVSINADKANFQPIVDFPMYRNISDDDTESAAEIEGNSAVKYNETDSVVSLVSNRKNSVKSENPVFIVDYPNDSKKENFTRTTDSTYYDFAADNADGEDNDDDVDRNDLQKQNRDEKHKEETENDECTAQEYETMKVTVFSQFSNKDEIDADTGG